MSSEDFRNLFEYEIHRKLSLRAKQSTAEMVLLINNFKFYDIPNTGKVNKDQWIKTFMKIGLSGFSDKDLLMLFDLYDPDKKGEIDYKHFTMSLYGLAERIPTGTVQQNYEQPPQINSQINSNNNVQIEKVQQNYQNNYNNNNNNYIQQVPSYNRTPINQQQQGNMNYEYKVREPTPKIQNQCCQQQQEFHMPPQTPMRNEVKYYFKSLLMLFRKKINTFEGLTYYTFLSKLKNEENPYSHQILSSSLSNILSSMKIDITMKEQNDFYSLIDLSDIGTISSNEFLRLIRGQLSDSRRMLIVNAFANIDKSKIGNCPIQMIKSQFNADNHPDVQLKRINPKEVENLFYYTFDTFCQYKGISDTIFLEDFVEYYEAISACIGDDDTFNQIICRVWNLPCEKFSNEPEIKNMNNKSSTDLTAATLKKLRIILSLRGTKGIFGILRLLKLFDKNMNGSILKEDFAQLCSIYKIGLSKEEEDSLFLGNTTVNYDLLIKAITGEMNEFRKKMVFRVFRMLDINDTNIIDAEKMKETFNPSGHPDVSAGKKNKDEIYGDFLDSIEAYLEYRGKSYIERSMSIEEFVEFYNMISMGIEDDGYFEYMMNYCWGLSQK